MKDTSESKPKEQESFRAQDRIVHLFTPSIQHEERGVRKKCLTKEKSWQKDLLRVFDILQEEDIHFKINVVLDGLYFSYQT